MNNSGKADTADHTNPEPSANPRLAIVVKYYHPIERISGIIGFLDVLGRQLAKAFDLHVISYQTQGHGTQCHLKDSYYIHKVGFPFPARAAIKLRELAPQYVMLVSGINNLRLAVPYFRIFQWYAPPSTSTFFYQATHVRRGGLAAMVRTLSSCASKTLAASNEIREIFVSGGLSQCEVLEPAVDVEMLSSIQPCARSARIRVGFVNHFTQQKGADLAFQVFCSIDRDDIEFVAAGTGKLAKRLRKSYGSRRNLTLLGYLDEGSRLALIKSCDIMILPFRSSVSILGISQTVLECMAMGVVLVGSDTPAITAAIDPGIDGITASTPEDFASHVNILCDDAELRESIKRSARTKVQARYDVRRACHNLSELILSEAHE